MKLLKIKDSPEIHFGPEEDSCLALGRCVVRWCITRRAKRWSVRPLPHLCSCAVHPQTTLIAVKNTAGRIAVLAGEDGSLVTDFKNQLEGEGSNVRFGPGGEDIVDGSWGGLLSVRKATTAEAVFQTCFPDEMITRVDSDREGKLWLTEHSPCATEDDQPPAPSYFLKWAWPIGNTAPERLPLEFECIHASAVSACGKLLAVIRDHATKLSIHALDSGDELWSLPVSLGNSRLRWSPCARYLGAVLDDEILIFDSANGTRLAAREMKYASDIDFSADGLLVAFGTWEDGEISDLPFARG